MIVLQSSIHSRTAYVISAVLAAETRESVLTRAESLVDHLHCYPEARDYAIKVTLPSSFRIRSYSTAKAIKESLKWSSFTIVIF